MFRFDETAETKNLFRHSDRIRKSADSIRLVVERIQNQNVICIVLSIMDTNEVIEMLQKADCTKIFLCFAQKIELIFLQIMEL